MAREPSIHASWTAGTIGVLPWPGRLIPVTQTGVELAEPTHSSRRQRAPIQARCPRGAGRAAAERARRRMRRPVRPAVTFILIAVPICPRDVPAARLVGIVH